MPTFFDLAKTQEEPRYCDLALKLIDTTHAALGKFRADDKRQGWISGLSEEEGARHPTAGGLRIGEKLHERLPSERFDDELEWERDGQYFHYLTRWVQALLRASRETGHRQYAVWAAELMKVGEVHRPSGWEISDVLEDEYGSLMATGGEHGRTRSVGWACVC